MRRSALIALLAVFPLTAVSPGCATTRMPGEQMDDKTITSKVAAKLAADPGIRKYDIDVDTIDRVVILSGHVDEARDKQEAERIARDTRGVRDVENELTVGEDPDLFDDNPDAWITSKIKARMIADFDTRAVNVDVDTDDRVVTLRGIVRNDQERQEIERIARSTEGVREVVNDLQVSDPHEAERDEASPKGHEQQGQQPSEPEAPEDQERPESDAPD